LEAVGRGRGHQNVAAAFIAVLGAYDVYKTALAQFEKTVSKLAIAGGYWPDKINSNGHSSF
jgi:hypothetical protein